MLCVCDHREVGEGRHGKQWIPHVHARCFPHVLMYISLFCHRKLLFSFLNEQLKL